MTHPDQRKAFDAIESWLHSVTEGLGFVTATRELAREHTRRVLALLASGGLPGRVTALAEIQRVANALPRDSSAAIDLRAAVNALAVPPEVLIDTDGSEREASVHVDGVLVAIFRARVCDEGPWIEVVR